MKKINQPKWEFPAMPPLRNIRQEKFGQGPFEGKSATRAYEDAGYRPHQGNSSRLRWFEMVQSRLAELQTEAAGKSKITVETLMDELEAARQKATDLNQLSAAVRATGKQSVFDVYDWPASPTIDGEMRVVSPAPTDFRPKHWPA